MFEVVRKRYRETADKIALSRSVRRSGPKSETRLKRGLRATFSFTLQLYHLTPVAM